MGDAVLAKIGAKVKKADFESHKQHVRGIQCSGVAMHLIPRAENVSNTGVGARDGRKEPRTGTQNWVQISPLPPPI